MYPSKYFPQKSQIYFKLILKYMEIILEDKDYYKNIKIDYQSYKDLRIDIIKNGKKQNVTCIMAGEYIKKTETFIWKENINVFFRDLIYKEFGEHFSEYGSRVPIEDFFQKECKIEDELSIMIPHIVILFYPQYKVFNIESNGIVYYFLLKTNDNKFTVNDVLIDISRIQPYLSRTKKNFKKGSKKGYKRDSKKGYKKNSKKLI